VPVEPTPGEVNRRLDDRFGELRQDIADLARRVDGKVSQDVYQIQYAALMKEITDLKAENATLRADRTRDAEKLAAMRRWWIGTVIMPLVAVLLTYVLSKGGGGSQ
jgi:hypothetical protein